MTILYFTATGNSLYIAKQFEATLVSIPQAIRSKKFVFSDDSLGIVCPLYKNRPPELVLDFLKKSTLSASYKFMILTYGHANFGAAATANKLLGEIGLDYIQTILMVDNYLPAFNINNELRIDKKIPEQLSLIQSDIAARVRNITKMRVKDKINNIALEKYFSSHPYLNDGSQIEITDKCVGCGICQKVCPTGNIELVLGKAVRKSQTCLFCLSCVNLCTAKALTIKSEKNPTARYRNPNISLHEIINSNCQT